MQSTARIFIRLSNRNFAIICRKMSSGVQDPTMKSVTEGQATMYVSASNADDVFYNPGKIFVFQICRILKNDAIFRT
jgi:hypothetical protein